MTYARPKRNYRSVERQIEREAKSAKGTFVADTDKPKLAAISVGVGASLFALGILIGALANKDW